MYVYTRLPCVAGLQAFLLCIHLHMQSSRRSHLSYTHTHRLCVSPSLVPSVSVSVSLFLRRARELSLFLSHALSPSGTQTLGRTLYTSTSMHCAHENTQVYPTSSTAFWRRAWYVCMCVCVCLCGCGFGSGSGSGSVPGCEYARVCARVRTHVCVSMRVHVRVHVRVHGFTKVNSHMPS